MLFVGISTTRSSAKADDDYTELTDYTITIPSDRSTVDVDIDIKDDEIRESDEYFIVRLSADEERDFGPLTEAKVFIVDDEGKIVVSLIPRHKQKLMNMLMEHHLIELHLMDVKSWNGCMFM